jgi:hypothetical protein
MIEINLQKLDRGTKTEWRTVTRGGKTFKQRFRVGKKTSDATEKIRVYEDTIRQQPWETGTAFNDKGDLVFTKDGLEDVVNFTKEEGESFEGLRFTHNHPKGSGFSPQDLKFACKAKMKEMRVISKTDGVRYVISMADGSNFTDELWEEQLWSAYGHYDTEIHIEFRTKINSGEMTIAQANKEHFRELWARVTKDIPELKYVVS